MLIDSNILIYSLNSSSPKHSQAQSFLQDEKDLSISQQNVFEVLRILTHPKFPEPFSAKQAVQAMDRFITHFTVVAPTFETCSTALALIEKYSIRRTEVFDAYLVATALTNGIETLATDNTKHLRKYQEITVVNPFHP